MRRGSKLSIVLWAILLPLAAWGERSTGTPPLWRSAHQTSRLDPKSGTAVKVIQPGSRQVEPVKVSQPNLWRANSRQIEVKRSSRPLSGLGRLFGRGREDSDDKVVQPAATSRWQQKGRIP